MTKIDVYKRNSMRFFITNIENIQKSSRIMGTDSNLFKMPMMRILQNLRCGEFHFVGGEFHIFF